MRAGPLFKEAEGPGPSFHPALGQALVTGVAQLAATSGEFEIVRTPHLAPTSDVGRTAVDPGTAVVPRRAQAAGTIAPCATGAGRARTLLKSKVQYTDEYAE